MSGELPEVLLQKLILAGQSILSTIADLKRSALLSDFPALNQSIKSKTEEYDALRLETERRVQRAIGEKESQVTFKSFARDDHQLRPTSLAQIRLLGHA